MIQLAKTTVILSLTTCLLPALRATAQETDEGSQAVPPARRTPPRANPSREEATPPAPGDVRPSLSEEARRSYRELPPQLGSDEDPTRVERTPPLPDRTIGSRARMPTVQSPPRESAASDSRRPEYIVEPPDIIIVEVLEALPGRPISGERLVRPDGTISLGFYGDIPVAGLTLPEIKERIVLHLRKFLHDGALGLVEKGPDGEPRQDARNGILLKNPRETDRVFVDVTEYNSSHCYVLGEVDTPGRLPYTGGDTVLDLIQIAGGVTPDADKGKIRLIRSYPKGSPVRVMPVDYDEIAMGEDSSTNYAILPNDRLVIPSAASGHTQSGRQPGARGDDNEPVQQARGAPSANRRMERRAGLDPSFGRALDQPEPSAIADLEGRIEELEQKLDFLIEKLGEFTPGPAMSLPKPRSPHVPEEDPFRDVEPAGAAPTPRSRQMPVEDPLAETAPAVNDSQPQRVMPAPDNEAAPAPPASTPRPGGRTRPQARARRRGPQMMGPPARQRRRAEPAPRLAPDDDDQR